MSCLQDSVEGCPGGATQLGCTGGDGRAGQGSQGGGGISTDTHKY